MKLLRKFDRKREKDGQTGDNAVRFAWIFNEATREWMWELGKVFRMAAESAKIELSAWG